MVKSVLLAACFILHVFQLPLIGITGPQPKERDAGAFNVLLTKPASREDIERGAADFGVDLTEHIQFVIDALRPHAAELGIERGITAAAE